MTTSAMKELSMYDLLIDDAKYWKILKNWNKWEFVDFERISVSWVIIQFILSKAFGTKYSKTNQIWSDMVY